MPRLAVLSVLSAASSPCPDLNLIHYIAAHLKQYKKLKTVRETGGLRYCEEFQHYSLACFRCSRCNWFSSERSTFCGLKDSQSSTMLHHYFLSFSIIWIIPGSINRMPYLYHLFFQIKYSTVIVRCYGGHHKCFIR